MLVAFSHEETSKEGYGINRAWQQKFVQNETEATDPEIPGSFFHPELTQGSSSLTHLLKFGGAMIPAYLTLVISFTLTSLTASRI